MCICVFVLVCGLALWCVFMYVFGCACTCACMHVCVRVCVYECVLACVRVFVQVYVQCDEFRYMLKIVYASYYTHKFM